MKIYLEEKIGNPKLFAGRKKEIADLLTWIEKIKNKTSQSTAILSRRKTGKSALLQRLYNLTFEKSNGVIPFYFEIKESPQWVGDLARDFFLTFISQYIAYKTRNGEYVSVAPFKTFGQAMTVAKNEGFDFIARYILTAQQLSQEKTADPLWDFARDAPRKIAEYYNEFVVQMIDEFQYLNRYIYRDEYLQIHLKDFVGSYLHTCEYKNAPLLVSGSWVGWLMDDLNRLLPGRFLKMSLQPMPEDEAIEMILKYSAIENIPVTDETIHLIAHVTEGNPFYISALMRSQYPNKDLTTREGVLKTLEFETLNPDAQIHAAWMEYIDAAFPKINEKYAKDIVLYLSKNRHKTVSRKELKAHLGITMSDPEFEKKLMAIYRADIIERDMTGFRGVQDNIFDKVFRSEYSDDIDHFLIQEAPNEYKVLFDNIQKKYKALSGEFNRYKGAYAEFLIIQHLKSAFKNPERYASMINNLPNDFQFSEFAQVWSYTSPPLYQPEFQIDIFAHAPKGVSIIGEVKYRKARFTVNEAKHFLEKAEQLKHIESIQNYILFVFSWGGFYKNTIDFMKQKGMVWSSDKRWVK